MGIGVRGRPRSAALPTIDEPAAGDADVRRPMGRKKKRQVERRMKKAKKNAWYTHQPKLSETPSEQQHQKPEKVFVRKTNKATLKEARPSRKDSEREDKRSEKARVQVERIKGKRRQQTIQRLMEENEDEDRLIKKLEKKLHLDRRKNKNTVPSSFSHDGLDYLLEVLENPSAEMDQDSEEEVLEEMDGDEEDYGESDDDAPPVEIVSTKNPANIVGILKKNTSSKGDVKLLEKSDEDMEAGDEDEDEMPQDEEDFDDEMENSAPEDEMEDDGASAHNVVPDGEEPDAPKEDIYGRFRDKQGNVVAGNDKQKYIPPALKNPSETDEKQIRLKRQLKGLLNRLTEANMAGIVSQVEHFYTQYSRHDMNETMIQLVLDSCVQERLMPKKFALEHGLFLGLLYQNIGQETGAFLVQRLLTMYDSLAVQETYSPDDKRLDNVVLLWCHMYNFKVLHSSMVFDLLTEFVERFREKDMDMFLLIMREVGFSLRKDNPALLKDSLTAVQAAASAAVEKSAALGSRVSFMLDILTAIRNNNIRKIPNYDPSELEHLLRIFRGLVRKGRAMESELKISLKDLRMADQRGKWWVVGAAWNKPELEPVEKRTLSSESLALMSANGRLLDLASKQRINTDVRKAIFCAVMGAEDYNDAFQRVMKLNLKSAQESEIVHVILHCALQEKKFNPFYSFLLEKFCGTHRTYQRQVLYTLWDKLRELSESSVAHQRNLARVVAHGILNNAIPITVLKKMNFADMNAPMVKFLRVVLSSLLLESTESTVTDVFSRLSDKKFKVVRESLRLFLRHFMVRNTKKVLRGDFAKFSEDMLRMRIDRAEKALNGSADL